jgi:hypothetical protein
MGTQEVARYTRKALPPALMNTFWSVRLFRLLNRFRLLEGEYCLHIQGQAVQPEEEGTTFMRNFYGNIRDDVKFHTGSLI